MQYAVKRLFLEGYAFLKAGVGLIDIIDRQYYQGDLFCGGQTAKTDELMTLLDKVNKRYGRGTLFTAAEGLQKKWYMRQTCLYNELGHDTQCGMSITVIPH